MTKTPRKRPPKHGLRPHNELLENFETEHLKKDFRSKIIALAATRPIIEHQATASEQASRARERLLAYFKNYPLAVISDDELKVVAGHPAWKRQIRELRVKFGWYIASGITIKQLLASEEWQQTPFDLATEKLKPTDHILMRPEQDRESPYRWYLARDIRKCQLSMKEKILEFLRLNVGAEISGEELRYVAGDKSEWARRVRELRTEEGWPVVSRNTGRPELPVGVYVLEEDRQSPAHDRKIPDTVRAIVLERDGYACRDCGWHQSRWTPDLPRHLELHHNVEHAKGGENSVENLITLCTVCHDERHRVTKTL